MNIWAHRGCCYAWPENTLQAFEAACKYPITGIELDIQLTKEGEIVVIHDEKVDRTTDGIGYVKDYTLQEIKKLKIKMDSTASNEIGYTQIPTIEEVFDALSFFCKQKGLLINIELKNSIVRYEGMEEKIVELVKKRGLKEYVIYSSFNPESVMLIKKLEPSAKTGILAMKLSDCLAFAEKNSVDALHPYIKRLDVDCLKNRTNLPVRAWNSKDYEPFYLCRDAVEIQDLIELEKIGVTDIFTNVPERYLERCIES